MARPTSGAIIPFPRDQLAAAWLNARRRFWAESLDQIAAYLETVQAREAAMSDLKFDYPDAEPSMICTRSFAAPLALVWKAFTDPVHVVRWWGPQSIAPVKRIDKLDLRKGGEWRFICQRPEGGDEIVFGGVYVDVVPMSKIANSFGVEGQFAGDPNYPEIHTFEERDGRTYYKSYTLLPSMEARDAMVATGMEAGGRESMEQLGALVDELAQQVPQ